MRQRLGRAAGELLQLAMAVNFSAGWARFLMGDDVALPWPCYPTAAVFCLWSAIHMIVEDAKPRE